LCSFGIFSPHFGMFCQEKSGNPAHIHAHIHGTAVSFTYISEPSCLCQSARRVERQRAAAAQKDKRDGAPQYVQ
jgi:hypothetical protein